MTANQNTVDGSAKGGKDWRAGRCASQNIIPSVPERLPLLVRLFLHSKDD